MKKVDWKKRALPALSVAALILGPAAAASEPDDEEIIRNLDFFLYMDVAESLPMYQYMDDRDLDKKDKSAEEEE